MSKRQVFYSFHYGNDVMRVQQVRNIGVFEGNTPVSPNEWESLKRKGNDAVEKWIDDNMRYRSCVIVLIGKDTAQRPWVRHEIIKAWNDGKGLFGIFIHNLNCPNTGTCSKGDNPFDKLVIANTTTPLSHYIKTYDPPAATAYTFIQNNISTWTEQAVLNASNRFG